MFKNIFKQKSKNRSHLEYANQFIAPVKKMKTLMVWITFNTINMFRS